MRTMTRTWLITGGSQGLGKALVLAALEAGDRVVATSRKPEALASLVAEHPERLATVALDVTSPAGLGAYQTAKFAVEGFSEVLANEVAPLGIKVTIVEPGGIRTGWAAGAAESSGPITPDYEQTVGAWLDRFAQYAGNEPGDPDRMARAIVDTVDAAEPPRRLLLGSDALGIAISSEEGRIAEANSWAKVSRSTDYPTA
jgi:NAD(P)-dependent dehydrogenase (short-subunit alcohol dehydrogenase family)